MVHTRGLSRRFDGRMAVDGLTLHARAGEVLSILGPNGAGKTTTFRMLAGLLPPSAGEATVDGVSITGPNGSDVRRRVGLLTEAPGLWERLTVRFNLLTYARLHGLAEPARRVEATMREVGVADRADERAGALSKGLKQRVAIARALLHDPSVVLLDEPTSGLDPDNARQVRDHIRALSTQGRAVLVSTHNLTEAEDLSDRIAVINTRLLALDSPQALRARLSTGTLIVEVEGDAGRWRPAVEAAGAAVRTLDGSRAELAIAAEAVPDLVAALVAAGARVHRVEPRQASLEDAYLALVRDDG